MNPYRAKSRDWLEQEVVRLTAALQRVAEYADGLEKPGLDGTTQIWQTVIANDIRAAINGGTK